MFINTNVGAMNAHRNLSANNTQMNKTMEKLSSGFRINRAADDAAGLAISENMRFQINGLQQAQRNAQDGISLIQTAEGALTEVHAMLQRINTLANQSANGTYGDTDRAKLQGEVSQLVSEITNIANNTTFNGIKLLNASASISFQVGFDSNTAISVNTVDMRATALGRAAVTGVASSPAVGSTPAVVGVTAVTALALNSVDIKTVSGANNAIEAVKSAIEQVSVQRANFGAVQNRLEHTINNIGVNVENLSAANSRIKDADMASEMTSFTKNQILVQAGTSMLAQANSVPQNVLKLLG